MLRCLVRRRNAREVLDLVGTGLGVEALRVARLADVYRGVDIHLNEAPLRHNLANQFTVGTVGRYERRDTDDTMASQQIGHLADAANVLGPVFLGKSEVRTKAVTDVVAIEHADLTAAVEQLPL